ncbi:hypothetical protein NDU88_006084 [Pleurodeles waltl]|uniref:Uncharacterized protein n=1 Tax=Pleurodeles waltl TaxID=8319 RepID=A0AAV7TCC0_PLEWA|nr:hypothetical protein NDU88_006084 [Pleurodeles waltl]
MTGGHWSPKAAQNKTCAAPTDRRGRRLKPERPGRRPCTGDEVRVGTAVECGPLGVPARTGIRRHYWQGGNTVPQADELGPSQA